MSAWYNEPDRFKAAMLRNLIEEGAIAHGVVDDRSIHEVQPEDLEGFTQCHFFAGIGLWSLALRRAGWPDDRPVWTGSCPCGPFSVAGKRLGFDDPRHLWPEWFRLIRVGWPDRLFGEQSADASAWLDLVSTDLESLRYAVGAVDLPAAGFAGNHKRQRFGFVADAHHPKWWAERAPWNDGHWPQTGRVQSYRDLGDGGASCGLAYANGEQLYGGGHTRRRGAEPSNSRPPGGLAYANDDGCEPWDGRRPVRPERDLEHGRGAIGLGDPYRSRLSDAELGIIRREERWPMDGRGPGQPSHPPGAGLDWLFCRDSKWRPVEPGTCPLVDESPARMGRLRAYGDAIDVEAFTNLIAAYIDVSPYNYPAYPPALGRIAA